MELSGVWLNNLHDQLVVFIDHPPLLLVGGTGVLVGFGVFVRDGIMKVAVLVGVMLAVLVRKDLKEGVSVGGIRSAVRVAAAVCTTIVPMVPRTDVGIC